MCNMSNFKKEVFFRSSPIKIKHKVKKIVRSAKT